MACNNNNNDNNKSNKRNLWKILEMKFVIQIVLRNVQSYIIILLPNNMRIVVFKFQKKFSRYL